MKKGGVVAGMQYVSGVYWHRGRAAGTNQDAVVLQQVLTARGRVLMAAVCGGMEELSFAEQASGYVADQLREWFYGELLCLIRRKKRFWVIRRSLDRRVFHMQRQLGRYAAKEEVSLGTTMTALVLWEGTWLLWHLGDSRAYRLRRGRIEQLTTDHLWRAEEGTKCVGSFGCFAPQHGMGLLRKGEGILLCTDGFCRRVSRRELGDVLRLRGPVGEEQIERRLKEIGGVCMERGETDHLSAVYIQRLA